jgi:hypothetical protein
LFPLIYESGEITNLKSVSRAVFDDMREKGYIIFDKFIRNNQITSRNKAGRRKHYFVVEPVYERYLKDTK